MVECAKEFDLRNGERTWATLKVNPDGNVLLCHQLGETELAMCPSLIPYEGTNPLRCISAVREEGPCVELVDSFGRLRLRLAEGEDGELFDAVDPLGDAELRVSLEGPGTVGNQPIQDGWLALKLRKVKTDPRIMMGKPVIRGTRITVELILHRLAGGASEDDLLQDYPQLTRDDIREALAYAARTLKMRRPAFSPPDTTPKS